VYCEIVIFIFLFVELSVADEKCYWRNSVSVQFKYFCKRGISVIRCKSVFVRMLQCEMCVKVGFVRCSK